MSIDYECCGLRRIERLYLLTWEGFQTTLTFRNNASSSSFISEPAWVPISTLKLQDEI